MSEKLTASQAQIVADFLRSIFQGIVEPLHSKLTAHLAALEVLKETHPDIAQMIDGLVNATLASSALRNSMHEKHHVTLEKSLQQFVEHAQDVESLEQMFQDLKQTSLN